MNVVSTSMVVLLEMTSSSASQKSSLSKIHPPSTHMASLRLRCSPSTPSFSTVFHKKLHLSTSSSLHKHLHQSNHAHAIIFHSTNSSLSCSLPHPLSLTHTLPVRTNKTSHFVWHFSSATQDHPVVDPSQHESSKTEEEEYSRTRLVAQNVPWTSTPEDIRTLFEKFGTVLDVELSMYNKTRNRGLAFVTMGSPEEALAAVNNLESYEFEGRALKMNYAKPKKEKPSPPPPPKPAPTFNLFVANLPFEAREKDLREFFNTQGANVVSVDIIFHDNPRRPSGYGFVAFKTKKEADEALSAFQGKIFMGRSIRVARSRQFVKEQRKEGLQSDETSAELKSDVEQADAADDN